MGKSDILKAKGICEREFSLLLDTQIEIEQKISKTEADYQSDINSGNTELANELKIELDRLNASYTETQIAINGYTEKLKHINNILTELYQNTPLPNDTALGDVVIEYKNVNDALEVHRKNIVESLNKKGLQLPVESKLSSTPEQILKLPTLGGDLEIIDPNVGAMIDDKDNEYNVSEINSQFFPKNDYYSSSAPNNSKNAIYTDNYIVWSFIGRDIYYTKYDERRFKAFAIPNYNINNCCSAHNGDMIYVFNTEGRVDGEGRTSMNLHVYDLSSSDLSTPKHTYSIEDCYNIAWCEKIDGVVYMLYKYNSISSYFFGTYNPGDSSIARKTPLSGDIPSSVSYDDKYFYVALGNTRVYYADRALAFEAIKYIAIPGVTNCLCITPVGDNLIISASSYGARLHSGVDSPNPLEYFIQVSSSSCDFGIGLDDTHVIISCGLSPYARILHITYSESTDSYSSKLVGRFEDISTSTMTNPGMVIAKSVSGKKYLVFTRFKYIFIDGFYSDIELITERRTN